MGTTQKNIIMNKGINKSFNNKFNNTKFGKQTNINKFKNKKIKPTENKDKNNV